MDGAKFCNKCGAPVQVDPAQVAKTKSEIEKLKKSVVTAGNSVYAIGWITILFNGAIYLWSLFDSNFADSGLPAQDLSGVYIMAVASVIFIILGNRIKRLEDRSIKIYLQVLLGISLLLLVWILGTGGRVGLLFFLVIIYLLSSIRSIRKLMKIEQFYSNLKHPEYKLNKNGWIIFGLTAIFLFFITVRFDSIIRNNFAGNEDLTYTSRNNSVGNSASKAELIRKIVAEAKGQTTFPVEVDGATTMIDIVAESSAIHYKYILHDMGDTDSLSNQMFHDFIKPDLCKSKDLLSLMDEGINIEYSYSVKGTQLTYFTSFTKEDCYAY
jgi:hypothetical protein